MSKIICLYYLCVFMAIGSLSAQSDKNLLWDSLKVKEGCVAYQKNEEKAKETYFLFSKNFQEKDYQACLSPCEWLLANYPCLGKIFYAQATSLFAKISENGKDEMLKSKYRAKEIELYDKRLTLFGEDLKLMERKGLKYYPYMLIEDSLSQVNARNPQVIKQLYDFYENLITKGDSNLGQSSNFIFYFDLLNKKNMLFKEVDREEYFGKYNKIRKIIERKIEIGDNKEQWENALSGVDGLMDFGTLISCEYIKHFLYPKFKENPNDKEIARIIVSQILKISNSEDKDKCMESETFKEALKVICYDCNEPAPLNIQIILYERRLHGSTDDKERSELLTQLTARIREQAEKTTYSKEKAKILMQLAKIYGRFHQNKIEEAYKVAIEIMQIDSSFTAEAYVFIGDMLISNYKSCMGENPITSRYVFLIAYDMYEKAGDNIGMSNAKNQFPSKSEIKQYGMEIGQVIEINCGLKAQSILRSRD